MRVILLATLVFAPLMAKNNGPVKRLNEAAAVFSEIMAAPDKGIPQDMLENGHCIVIVPSLKTASFLVGGKYGKGYVSCRSKTRSGWSAPGTVRIEGGSVGFQIGGSQTDLIMLVMNERGADKLLSSKFTLGAEGSVAAGPWAARRPRRPMRRCTRRFSHGREARDCSQALRWKARLYGRTWTITRRFTAGSWRIARS